MDSLFYSIRVVDGNLSERRNSLIWDSVNLNWCIAVYGQFRHPATVHGVSRGASKEVRGSRIVALLDLHFGVLSVS